MPNRIVREGLLTSRSVNSLSETAQLFYARLMLIVDDFGRFEADLDVMRARLFPLALDLWPISRMAETLNELSTCPASDGFPLVLVYEVDGHKYLEIHKFSQQIRSKKSKCPEPSARQALSARVATDSTCIADAQHVRTKTNPNPNPEASAEANPEKTAPARKPPAQIREMPRQDYGVRYRALYDRHIIPGFQRDGEHEYFEIISRAVNPETVADSIDQRHAEWMQFFRDNPSVYRPGIGKWLNEGYFTRSPVKAREPPAPKMTRVEMARQQAEERRKDLMR